MTVRELRILLAVLVLALVWCLVGRPTRLHAQTPVPTLEYEFTRPLAEVTAYAQVVQVNGTTVAGAPSCVAASASVTRCTIPVPTLPATGSNTVSIAATANGQTAETRITGVSLANLPGNATNPKIKVTVTVTIGS